MEQVGTLLQGLASLAWPLIVAAILFGFRGAIKTVLESAKSRKFTVKVGGNELTMEEASEQQRLLISDLQSQIVTIQKTLDSLTPAPTRSTPTVVEDKEEPVKSILWVDDKPRNNATLIENLSELGIRVVTALSTAEAMATFETGRFDRVISDLGRTEGGTYVRFAGLDLTKQIRAVDRTVPIIIYSSARAAQTYKQEALAAGATAITSSPTALINELQLGGTTLTTS